MLSRNSSGALTSKSNIDNLSAALVQKDKIINILQKQLEGFRLLRENYDRLKDRKLQLLEKCQSSSRQISISRDNQTVRQDTSQKSIIDLKMIVASLENQLQNKQYQLKDLKSQAQILIKSSQQKQNDLLEYNDAIDSVRSNIEILKLETERVCSQILQTKEEIERIKQYQYQTQSTIEKIKSQAHNTQTFIRKLTFQESKLTEALSGLEDQNNSIDEIIEDLKKVQEITRNKIRDTKDQREEVLLKIKTKELQKGRISTEFAAKMKQYKAEKQKQKTFNEVGQARKQQVQRLTNLLKEVNQQNDQFTKNNLQVESINNQLRTDLNTCKKHLQNVSKTNVNIKEFLDAYIKTNMTAIKKLRRPLDQGWPDVGYHKKDLEDMETGEGFLEKTA